MCAYRGCRITGLLLGILLLAGIEIGVILLIKYRLGGELATWIIFGIFILWAPLALIILACVGLWRDILICIRVKNHATSNGELRALV
jgi:hypothetical protein